MTSAAWALVALALLLVGRPAPGADRIRRLRERERLRLAVRRHRSPSTGLGRSVPRAAGVAVLSASVVGIGVVLGLATAVATVACVGTALRFGLDRVRGRAGAARRRDLLGAVRVLVAEVEAGSGAEAALSSAARAGPLVAADLAAAAAVAAAGGSAGSALAGSRDADLRRVGLAWSVGDDAGAPRALVLGRVADDLAGAEDQRRAVEVALAGPRASAAVLAALPLLGVGLGVAMGADPLGVLAAPGAGRALACAGVLLDLAGLWWMRRLVLGAQW